MENRTSEIIYRQMLSTTPERVAKTAISIFDSVQSQKVRDQVLGLAAALICVLESYELSHVDVLGLAHNYVFSDYHGNMKSDFRALKKYIKSEWEL